MSAGANVKFSGLPFDSVSDGGDETKDIKQASDIWNYGKNFQLILYIIFFILFLKEFKKNSIFP